MRKSLINLMVILLMMVPIAGSAGGIGERGQGVPGNVYFGEAPVRIDPEKSPVVFVHGYHNSASVWWEGNDMYEKAVSGGFETAFIDLHPDKDMWENGRLLSKKLEYLYEYFGKKKLVVVGYSKGGVDTQAALVHYGAHPYVSNVITLSSPHHGTQLSDLAHSSLAGWLAARLDSQNDATRSLQTGYMAYFRSITDMHENAARNRYYTLGGTKWGAFGSSIFWTGLYLRSYGQNDGVVTIASSRLPGGAVINEGAWNHVSIREGSSTFEEFKPYILKGQPAEAFAAGNAGKPEPDQIIRTGKDDQPIKERFLIEEGANGFIVALLSDQRLPGLKLKSPDGVEYKSVRISRDKGGFFEGAWVHHFKVEHPNPGKWTLSGSPADYFYTVSIDSLLGEKIQSKSLKASYKTKWIHYRIDSDKKLKEIRKGSKVGKVEPGDFKEPGIYNLTTEAFGIGSDGEPFERTIVESIYVDQNGKIHRR